MTKEVTVKLRESDERGNSKVNSYKYIVHAVNNTDAEAIMYDLFGDNEEFSMPSIKDKKAEVLANYSGDKVFEVKINALILDEGKGTEKKEASTLILWANDLPQAVEFISLEVGKWIVDCEIESVKMTKVVDIIYPEIEEKQSKDA